MLVVCSLRPSTRMPLFYGLSLLRASPEGQEIIDKYEPLKASVFTPGSATEQVTRGKALSVVDWGHFTKFQEYTEKIIAAFGFPKADK